MSREEIFEVLGDINGQLNDVFGLVQILEENADEIERYAELSEAIEGALDLSGEIFDAFGDPAE